MLRLPSLCSSVVVVAVLSLQFITAQKAPAPRGGPVNIEETCKAIGRKYPEIAVDFCVSSLKHAAKTTHPADDRFELAGAATRLAITHAESTETKVDDLMDLETDPATKNCFNECMEAYGENIDRMKDAVDNISTHVYGKAISHLRFSLKAVDKCEEVFRNASVPCPLGTVDRDYSKLASIALGLLQFIK